MANEPTERDAHRRWREDLTRWRTQLDAVRRLLGALHTEADRLRVQLAHLAEQVDEHDAHLDQADRGHPCDAAASAVDARQHARTAELHDALEARMARLVATWDAARRAWDAPDQARPHRTPT